MFILRRIFFFIFLTAYLVLCPLILFYSFGYVISPLTHEVERTGLIYLSTTPSGAHIYLENSRYVNTTPASIQNLLPGKYTVTLWLPGHKLWKQAITVEAGKAAAFDKILLASEARTPQALLPLAFNQLVPLPGTEFFLLVQGPDLRSVRLYNWKKGTAVSLVDEHSPYAGLQVQGFSCQENSRTFIVQGTAGLGERQYFFVEIKGQVPEITDITKLFPGQPASVQWGKRDSENIFASYFGHVDRLNVKEQALYPRFLEDVKGYGFYNGRILVLKPDNTFVKYVYDKERKEVPVEDVDLAPVGLGQDISYRILAREDNFFIFWGVDGRLLSNRLPYQLADAGVQGVAFSERENSFLFWTRESVTAAVRTDEEGKIPKKVLLRTIYSGGKDIRQCSPVFDAAHVLCQDGSKFLLIEVGPQASEHVDVIATIKSGSSIFFARETGCVYFLDEAGRLKKLKICPAESVVEEFLKKDD
ncbi:MAG: PEGA domain-containing protein [Candidatus Omnitrophica bacterium]|nr:PEGA domain-containing protein [Candidatus Omnitrophota bacterium]